MSRSWNGSDLQTEFSTLLGDTSTGFKSKVLEWMNEVQNDICSRHDWPFMRFKGKKDLTASVEEHSLRTDAPGAPTIAIAAGGSLTEDSTYSVIVTFEDSNGYETPAGTASSTVTATSVNKTVSLTSIPTSGEDLVTKRHIYISKDSGTYVFDQTISDNTTTTATITSETSSTIEPPDYHSIRKIDGNPFFESDTGQLIYVPVDQLRLLFAGAFTDGTPQYWSDLTEDKILIYPRPSSAATISYYYYQLPPRLFADADRTIKLPVWLKPVLRAGVVALGYEYRDRDGQESKRNRYEQLMSFYISRTADNINAPLTVRDLMGDTDGFSYG